MDNNPEAPPVMIKLESSDGEIFQVEVKAAKLSLTIKDMLDCQGTEDNDDPIPLTANAHVVGKIVEWANHHKDDPTAAEADEREEKSTDDMSSWDAELLQVDDATLFQMIKASSLLQIKGLLDITCKQVAKMIKGKDAGEVRQRFNIPTEYSPDEEKQIREENRWSQIRYRAKAKPKNPTDCIVLDVDNEARHVIKECLGIIEIVNNIFQHLSCPHLLELSTMNSMWYKESRHVVRKRGKLMAVLPSFGCDYEHYDCSCWEQIEIFGLALRQMNLVPYSGLDMDITYCDYPNDNDFPYDDEFSNDDESSYKRPAAPVEPTREAILNLLPIKQFSVSINGDWPANRDCQALLLVKYILEDFSGVLEKLTFSSTHCQGSIVEDYNFPCLKELELEDTEDTSDDCYTSYIIKFLSQAPNLQRLYVHGEIDLSSNVMEGSEAVLVYAPIVSAPFDKISESVIGALRLETLELVYPPQFTHPDFDFDMFLRMSPMLLKASCTTSLFRMLVDVELAVLLMCYGISFENVDDLEINLPRNQLESHASSRIFSIVKNFDFTRIFPKVKKPSVLRRYNAQEFHPSHISRICAQVGAFLGEPRPDRATNIKELLVRSKYFPTTFLAHMFPDIEKLIIQAAAELEIGSIWEHWRDLQALEVDGKLVQKIGYLGNSL